MDIINAYATFFWMIYFFIPSHESYTIWDFLQMWVAHLVVGKPMETENEVRGY
jgi:hypothetical protein